MRHLNHPGKIRQPSKNLQPLFQLFPSAVLYPNFVAPCEDFSARETGSSYFRQTNGGQTIGRHLIFSPLSFACPPFVCQKSFRPLTSRSALLGLRLCRAMPRNSPHHGEWKPVSDFRLLFFLLSAFQLVFLNHTRIILDCGGKWSATSLSDQTDALGRPRQSAVAATLCQRTP